MRRTFGSSIVVALAALGCSQLADQGKSSTAGYSVGFVDSGGISTSPIDAPDTVLAGARFTVTISTFGSTGCIRPDQSQVQLEGSVANITPYDGVWSNNPPCPPGWQAYPRTVQLRFDMAGTGRSQLHGRGFERDPRLQRTSIFRPQA